MGILQGQKLLKGAADGAAMSTIDKITPAAVPPTSNKTTGTSVIDKPVTETPQNGGPDWSSMEGYDPNKELFSDSSPTKIVQGSEDVRDQISGTKSSASGTLANINNAETSTTIADLKKTLGYIDPNAALTDEQNQQVASAEMEASNEYLPLISAAEESQRMGMPKAVIGAGEKGGFESTQYAGAAALASTNGGTFVGKGGLLGEIKSGYERNIQDLKVKQLQAMKLARAKAIEAIRTGNELSNKDAKELYKLAKEADTQAIEKQQKLVNLTKSYREEDEARITSIAGSLSSVLGDDNKANMKAILDAADEYDIDPNFLIGAVNKQSREDMFFKSGDFVSLMKGLPAGETRQLQDPFTGRIFTIEGASTDAPDIITVTDDKGTVTGRDKVTGEVLWKTEPGAGKTKTQGSSITINAAGERTPVYLKGKQIGYQTYNNKTGKTSFVSSVGEYPSSPEGTLPAGSELGTFSAGNPTEEDALGNLIEEAIN